MPLAVLQDTAKRQRVSCVQLVSIGHNSGPVENLELLEKGGARATRCRQGGRTRMGLLVVTKRPFSIEGPHWLVTDPDSPRVPEVGNRQSAQQPPLRRVLLPAVSGPSPPPCLPNMSGGASDAGAGAGIVPAERLQAVGCTRGSLGRSDVAPKLFDGMPQRSMMLWNMATIQSRWTGRWREAFLHTDVGDCRDHVLRGRNPENRMANGVSLVGDGKRQHGSNGRVSKTVGSTAQATGKRLKSEEGVRKRRDARHKCMQRSVCRGALPTATKWGPPLSPPLEPDTASLTSASGPQAGAIDSSARDDNASFDTPAAALLSADQVEPRSRSPAPAIPRKLTLEEEQALCLVRQLAPGDVGFVGSSPCLVRLLKEGCEVVRRIVFDGVMGALHFVTGSSAWRVVFVELLRAGSFDELKVIVNVAC
ncbi:uncharacterized protein C2845_PM02G34760 [Panicum miliaceum]|uniref:Uncharacterized protein n=1 Tax=Panicum miliaceum TaxID=4540 RepID=A0A3L6S8K8_PANMI|nr:uncharacterized protein C2845_PM02G34760 [Panicum miliaceum]